MGITQCFLHISAGLGASLMHKNNYYIHPLIIFFSWNILYLIYIDLLRTRLLCCLHTRGFCPPPPTIRGAWPDSRLVSFWLLPQQPMRVGRLETGCHMLLCLCASAAHKHMKLWHQQKCLYKVSLSSSVFIFHLSYESDQIGFCELTLLWNHPCQQQLCCLIVHPRSKTSHVTTTTMLHIEGKRLML